MIVKTPSAAELFNASSSSSGPPRSFGNFYFTSTLSVTGIPNLLTFYDLNLAPLAAGPAPNVDFEIVEGQTNGEIRYTGATTKTFLVTTVFTAKGGAGLTFGCRMTQRISGTSLGASSRGTMHVLPTVLDVYYVQTTVQLISMRRFKYSISAFSSPHIVDIYDFSYVFQELPV